MSRSLIVWSVIGVLLVSAGCWGRSVWADHDGGLNTNHAPGCGNDRLEQGEQCDGNNLAGYSCQILGFSGGTLSCAYNCTFDTSGCGATPDCGNGNVDLGEDCDGAHLDGMSCSALGYAAGTLSCTGNCRFDTSLCQTFEGCGNGVLDPGEQCDDGNTHACDGCNAACRLELCANGIIECEEQCDDGNLQSGDGCSASCLLEWVCGNGVCEASAGENCGNCPSDCCNQCGNHLREPSAGEECDGPDLGGLTCHDFCFAGGTLQCTSSCTLDYTGCYGGPPCGDGVAECQEECDLFDLGGASCQSLGFTGGALGCSVSCTFDTSGCNGVAHYLYETFESSSLPGWTLSGDWEWGQPVGFGDEPPAAYEGQYCLGTRMGQNYTDNRQYMNNMAVSPLINLTNASSPVLRFHGWITAEQCCDGANLWVRPQGSSLWTHLSNPSPPYVSTINGYSAWTGSGLASWVAVEHDLSAYTGQTLQIAFAMRTDSSVTLPGAYVDEVIVTESGEIPVAITSADDLGLVGIGEAFSTQLTATGGSGAYQWNLEPGGFNDGWLSIISTSGVLSGTPTAANAGPVEVMVRAAAQGNPSNFDERLFRLEVVSPFWEDTFDAGAIGWTLAGDWQSGTPSMVGQGPSACQSGSCIGLQMAAQYHNDLQWNLCTATSPPIDLAGTLAPRLQFWSYVDTEGNIWDGGNLKVSTGGPVFNIVQNVDPPYNLNNVDGQAAWGGYNWTNGWQLFEADLSGYAGQTIRLQFAFRSDGTVTASGWYVDELVLLDY